MENLIFSLNATVPVFLMMLLGLVFRKAGWIDDAFASKMNQFVFRVPLPLLVFSDLASVDFDKVWNMKFILFCFFVTVLSIGISVAISYLWKDKSIQGEFVQASYRSSAALLGIAFIQNIYGT
ncbi:MAG: AEC family transporter, partial [Dorea sp.]